MKKRFNNSILLIIIILCIIFQAYGCTNKIGNYVTWIGADGAVIESQYLVDGINPLDRELPMDTNEWHYTEWKIIGSNNSSIVCVAQRVPKKYFVWKDEFGNIIHEQFAVSFDETNVPDLPRSNEKWLFTEWVNDQNSANSYVAKAIPNTDYFKGNVFQIILKDEAGELLSSGSGFILNKEGWFITNNHVMEGGYTATAFFDIVDFENGYKYTQLEVEGGVYNSEEKDIFIGKLSNYESINNYYNEILFESNYEIGEVTYSIGYPNSSLNMQINEGNIIEEYADIYDKIDGKYYVLSDSYIAPGSSGGILINKEFKVIGITTMGLYLDEEKEIYIAGGSVPTIMFASSLNNLDESKIKKLTEKYDVYIK